MLVSLPQLELLDLSDCEQITDATIKAIVFHCCLLRSLNVSGCTRVSYCYTAGWFSICNKFQLTDASVKYLSQGCAYLSVLNFSSSNITLEIVTIIGRLHSTFILGTTH